MVYFQFVLSNYERLHASVFWVESVTFTGLEYKETDLSFIKKILLIPILLIPIQNLKSSMLQKFLEANKLIQKLKCIQLLFTDY